MSEQQHKSDCNNENRKCYNFKVYKTIRDTGGFSNWTMIEVEKYPCKDTNEATARERHWFERLDSSLSTSYPQRRQEELTIKKSEKYQDNKEELIIKQRQYRKDHKAETNFFYEDQRVEINIKRSQYNNNHKEKILIKAESIPESIPESIS